MPDRDAVLAAALPILRAQLGVHEVPRGSNRQKYGAVYGWNGVAWCVQFAWWVAQQLGLPSAYFPKTASVAQLRSWARVHGRWSGSPRVLDVGLFPYGVSHAVIVEKLVAGNRVQCVAGNTNAAGSRDADTVCRKVYPASCFSGFFRPEWTNATRVSAPPAATKTPTKPSLARVLRYTHPHMKGADVNRVQKRAGAHADGVFGPHTDAEVRAFQRRHGLTVDGDVGPKTARALGFTWKG